VSLVGFCGFARGLTDFPADEEEIDKLSPNYVLFKAATAHNLPVMMQAISLGADKNWENPENLNRTPMHQAILAVS
jgi:Arf-GAP with coiled-coil, ANK repeat and PH domain-containing protein